MPATISSQEIIFHILAVIGACVTTIGAGGWIFFLWWFHRNHAWNIKLEPTFNILSSENDISRVILTIAISNIGKIKVHPGEEGLVVAIGQLPDIALNGKTLGFEKNLPIRMDDPFWDTKTDILAKYKNKITNTYRNPPPVNGKFFKLATYEWTLEPGAIYYERVCFSVSQNTDLVVRICFQEQCDKEAYLTEYAYFRAETSVLKK